MALVKKGARRIVVDGAEYRWRVRRKPSYSQANGWTPLTFAVGAGSGTGSVLVVRTGRPHPRNWFGQATDPVVPAEVVQAVRAAIEGGWTPLADGPPFLLDVPQGAGTESP
jgi:hypothetical protein